MTVAEKGKLGKDPKEFPTLDDAKNYVRTHYGGQPLYFYMGKGDGDNWGELTKDDWWYK